jgi:hemin uptake protein HemP
MRRRARSAQVTSQGWQTARGRLSAKQDDEPKDAEPAPARVRSETLLQGARALKILHRGEVYTLRLTHRGKLILTK